jgi:hypothetical protein
LTANEFFPARARILGNVGAEAAAAAAAENGRLVRAKSGGG